MSEFTPFEELSPATHETLKRLWAAPHEPPPFPVPFAHKATYARWQDERFAETGELHHWPAREPLPDLP